LAEFNRQRVMMEQRRRPLRVGILANGSSVARWQADILRRISDLPAVDVCTVVLNGEMVGEGRWRRYLDARRYKAIPFRLLSILDAWLCTVLAGHPLASVEHRQDLRSILPSADFTPVTPKTSSSGLYHRFAEEDIETIRKADLDVMIRFGFGILQGDILDVPRSGILSFHHADNRVSRGGPPGFWEWYGARHQTGVTLQVLTEELDNGRVVARGSYQTKLWSFAANRRHAFLEGQMLLVDAVRRLATGHPFRFEDENESFNVSVSPVFKSPNALQCLGATALLLKRVLAQIASRLMRRGNRWEIFIAKTSVEGIDEFSLALRRAVCLKPPRGRIWADPFIVQRDDGVFLFFEDVGYREKKGKISYLRLDENASVIDYGVALEREFHLSYPFLLEDGDELFMIPEASESRKVSLYRCVDFPGQWEHVTDILDDLSASDSTVLRRDGKYWLFSNIDRNESGNPNYELHVFWAESLDGPWIPLQDNPVVIDASTARMAGGFIEDRDGGLYRCSQINGSRYGEGLNFMRVDNLTVDGYRESRRLSILPDWGDFATMHHIDVSSNWITFDASK
jgi:hypothetical protein